MNKIVIKANGVLTYKEVTEKDLSSLQKEIEGVIKAHRFSKVNADKVCVSVKNSNGGNVVISMEEYTCVESICNICSADFREEELSIKEAISFNITNILESLDDIVTREKNETN